MENKSVEVSICCITYNQKEYVREALDSFLSQKMDVNFEIIVHDDASTDGTAEIVKEYIERYPNIIKGILQNENQFSKGNRRVLLNNLLPVATGKYIAVCEGDDYWCDVDKLHRQLEFIKAHPECAVCVHRTEIIHENGSATGATVPSMELETGIISSDDYINRVFRENRHLFHTSSILFPRKAVESIVGCLPEFMKVSEAGDRALFLYLATKGDIAYIDRIMSKYRVMRKGSWSEAMRMSAYKTYMHNLTLIKMANLFDVYTDRKYTDAIYEYTIEYEFSVLMYEMNGRKMKQPQYRKFYDKLSEKQKIYFNICSYFPVLGKVYRKIKLRIKKG